MIMPDDAPTMMPWPAEVLAARRTVFEPYMRGAHSVGMLVLGVLARSLGIDPAEFERRHRIEEKSEDHVRITRGPPRENEDMPEIQTPSHTDFGTITILMNWLGGLQVWSESARQARLGRHEPDGAGEWLWVPPRPGCAIVNLGDAAVKFTNGEMCAGRHRVIPSPGAQGKWPRYSIVYFVRPEDACPMRQLRGGAIPDGPAGGPEDDDDDDALPAREWIYRQAQGLGFDFKQPQQPQQPTGEKK
ncbi:hypothetical protein GGR56DRAFT_618032 [Xylariaceae sp. FL0804]|nr:hypothetical protein GGR56DRAFT_618032 [Xylariaceae sp. FL0804]